MAREKAKKLSQVWEGGWVNEVVNFKTIVETAVANRLIQSRVVGLG